MKGESAHVRINFVRGKDPKETIDIGLFRQIKNEMDEDNWDCYPWFSSTLDKAIVWASTKGKIEYVRYLIKIGANVHMFDDFSLQSAAHGGHTEIVRILLDAGADVHANDGYALIWAAQGGQYDTVKILLEAGADVHINNSIAFELAAERGHTDLLDLLKKYGAKDP